MFQQHILDPLCVVSCRTGGEETHMLSLHCSFNEALKKYLNKKNQ